jgi:hypothetical protein
MVQTAEKGFCGKRRALDWLRVPAQGTLQRMGALASWQSRQHGPDDIKSASARSLETDSGKCGSEKPDSTPKPEDALPAKANTAATHTSEKRERSF